ncbi:transcription factor HES-2-like [Rhopilema esculentum]|uniref:transcription factor HES-2-like n=1 Tax=Rhopilema esculentum TaxID=499914 RepID=UPI0031E38B66|eukprot:gene2424-18076_t
MKPGVDEQSKNGVNKKKFSKPLMERRRRARINESLNELKSLVLSSLNKDHSKFNKMEKADVLELTVNYLKSLNANEQRSTNDTEQHFVAGYNECAREVQSYLLRSNEVNPQVKARMLSHISAPPQEMTSRSNLHSQGKRDEHAFVAGKPGFSPVISAYPSPPASPVGVLLARVPHSPNETTSSPEFQWTSYLENRLSSSQERQGLKKSFSSQRLWRPWQSL